MVPAVPFAALGVTALLAVAAWAALAAAALALRGLRLPALLLAAGAGVLAVVEVLSAVQLGDEASDPLVLLRAGGALLLTAGLALGALGRPLPRPDAAGVAGVVAPLAAAPAPSVVAGAATLAAALTLLRSRRDAAAVCLAGGLTVAAAAVLLAPLADDDAARALLVLGLRAAGAVGLLVGLALLAQTSLLAKVVATTLAGVLAMGAAAVGVVGTVVSDSYDRQASDIVRDAAAGTVQSLQDLGRPLVPSTRQVEQICRGTTAACKRFLEQIADGRTVFAARIAADGEATYFVSRGLVLDAVEKARLRGLTQVRALLAPDARPAVGASDFALVRLSGLSGRLAAVAVVPQPRVTPDLPVASVTVFGVLVTDATVSEGLLPETYGVVVLAGDPYLAVATRADDGEAVLDRARPLLRAGIGEGTTVAADGRLPTLRLQPLVDDSEPVGVVAVTRPASLALASERSALVALLFAAVAATGLVALGAVVAGRRTVDPVRRLTVAAERLSAGDLDARGDVVRSRDEVGVLARTFDTMTGSLSRLTGDLRSSAARLETVLASMSDGLLATDADGTVTSVNRAALEMLGAGAGDVVGRPLAEVADVRGADGAPLADVDTRVQDAVGEVHRADGTTVPVRVAVTGLRDGDGAVVVLRDTTREREVERMKTEFLSNVSHELRTPLTPIRGYADILTNRPGLAADKVTRFAGTILSEALKMNRVVDLLVDVASLEAGRVVPRPVDVDVRQLLDSRLEAWRAKAPERADDLRRRVGAGLPSVHVDPEWVGKALDELIDNAVKYSPAGASITLAATVAPDGRVRVAVRDTGPGIAEADQALLFTSFEQVDGSATRRVGGLGLGLSFVRRVADDAGLLLTVTSQVGKGSEFALDLPAGATAPASRAARR